MIVESTSCDTELICEPVHRQRTETLFTCDVQRLLRDHPAAQHTPALRIPWAPSGAAALAAALFATVSAACSLAPYVAVYATVAVLFGENAGAHDTNTGIVQIAGWTAAALLLKAAAGALANHLGHLAAYAALADLRLAIGRHFQLMPLGRVQARSAGETKKILHDDVEQLEEALAHGVPDGASAAAVPLVTTAVLFAIDWRLALAALASLVLLAVFSALAMALAQKNNEALAAHSGTLNRAVMGYLRGIKVIRGYMRPDSGYDQARQAVLRSAELQIAATSGPMRWLASGLAAATGFTVALILPLAGLGYAGNNISLGTLALFLLISLAYLSPIITLVGTLATILTRFQKAADSIRGILEEEPLTTADQPETPETFEVTFDGVSFGYSPDRPALESVSLSIGQGEHLALVGGTGGGKSTLAKLLMRFHDPDQGTISIGGVDVRNIPAEQLLRIVAFVQQHEYIFEASLLENIRIARPSAPDEEVWRAAILAQLSEVAADLPQGWETVLSAGGESLSGGQRQRIAIARALLKDARIVILDEATASLDAVTEQLTLKAISTLTADRTVIAIAHRLETIRDSDRIAVISSGLLDAVGTHHQLLDSHRTYQQLWEAYRNAEGWALQRSGPGSAAQQPYAPEPPAGPVTEPASAAGQPPGGIVRPSDAQPSSVQDSAVQPNVAQPGVGAMSFLRQWRTLYGRRWGVLLRRGVPRLVGESVVRGAPLVAVFVVVLAALGEGPWGGLDARMVWWITGLTAGALVLRLLAATWANSLVWRLSAESKAELQLSVIDRLRQVPMGFFNRMDTGRTGTLICNDLPMLDFQNTPQQILGSLVQPLYATTILLIIDWRLALAALAGVPVFWALTALSDRTYHRVFADVHQA